MNTTNSKDVAEAHLKPYTISGNAACCVNNRGQIIAKNTILDDLLMLDKDDSTLSITDIDPSMSLLAWKTRWQEVNTQKQLNTDGKLFRQNGDILDTGITHIYVEAPQNQFITLVFLANLYMESTSMPDRMMRYSVDNAHEMIFWIDIFGNIIYVNNEVLSKTGYTHAEINKMKAWHFSEAVKTAEEWTAFFNTVKEKTHHPLETEQYRKDGGINYVDTVSTYMNFEGKEYVFSIVLDVTKNRERELRLREALADAERLREQLENERNYLKQEINIEHNFNEILTRNVAYRKVLQQVQQVATTDATVLILGETGTGKELIARAIHDLSARSEQTMVKVNCAALPANLIESELFGHEKGAFTGAYSQKIGRFELAGGGTIFLDEIGEVPISLQAKLLRTLQEGEVMRIGGVSHIKVDVRIIAATNRDLREMILEGTFREDLYYRLNVFPIHSIPLRERRDDIELLTKFFVKKYGKKVGKPKLKITQAAMMQLMRYEFPGNVRELENLVERATILSKNDILNLNAVFSSLTQKATDRPAMFPTLEEAQRQHIIEALKRTNWRVTGKQSAAELLQINGKTLVSRMQKLNIKRENLFL